jgi:hypothetical protein
MFQDQSKISDTAAVDQFKKFSIIAIVTAVFGLVLLHYIGAIAIVCLLRTSRLSNHPAVKTFKDRHRYLTIAYIGGVLGLVGVLVSVTA